MSEAMASLLMGEEEAADLRRRERARRQGHKWIRVVRTTAPESFNRIHDIKDIVMYQETNTETGVEEEKFTQADRVLEFTHNAATGDWEAWVLDCVYNRYFLARQIDVGIRIDPPNIAKAIRMLKNKPYKVEVDEVEQIERDITNKQTELIAAQKRKAAKEKEAAEIKAIDEANQEPATEG